MIVQPTQVVAVSVDDEPSTTVVPLPGCLKVVCTESVGGTSYKVVTIGFPVTLFIPNLASDTLSLSVTRRVPIS